jgi:CPA1 family monovalent cation:H+ antiporter
VVDLPQSLLEITLLLAAAVFLALWIRRRRLPLTVVLAVSGFIAAWLGGQLEIIGPLRGEAFKEVVIFLFLPILVFDAVLAASTREFLRNLVPIVALATVALAIAAVLVGTVLHVELGVPVAAALLFGVLISATDPVAVVAVFRDVGVPQRLLTLVEGESLLNDGVAIVGYELLLAAALTGSVSILGGIGEFTLVFFGGALVGLVVGTAAALVLPYLEALPTAALTLAVAYGTFVMAETIFGFSGVMATVAAGLVIGGMIPSRASESVRELLQTMWAVLAYIANALLFLFVGLVIRPDLIGDNLQAIGVALAAVLVARPLAVVPIVSLLERVAHIPHVGQRNAAVLVWGGLRGGVALALALALPEALPERDMFIAMAGGVVLGMLILNATTIEALVHYLGLSRPTKAEQFLTAGATLLGVEAARETLDELNFSDAIVDARLDVVEQQASDIFDRINLTSDEVVEIMTLQGLRIERETYQRLSDAGLLPPMATRTLIQEIDDELDELSVGLFDADAARRGVRPWYAKLSRRVLGALPPPLGVDLAEIGYVEVSARRLAAHHAGRELELFERLPNCDPAAIAKVEKLFAHWEDAAARRLGRMDETDEANHRVWQRRQAEALSRATTTEALADATRMGLFSEDIAQRANDLIGEELERIHHEALL